MNRSRPHCLLIGIGPGTGAACARKFTSCGYKVSMISRSEDRLRGFADEIQFTTPYCTDLADTSHFRDTLERIGVEQGLPQVILFNATQATRGHYSDIPIEKFERNFRVNTTGLLTTAQVFAPAMAVELLKAQLAPLTWSDGITRVLVTQADFPMLVSPQ